MAGKFGGFSNIEEVYQQSGSAAITDVNQWGTGAQNSRPVLTGAYTNKIMQDHAIADENSYFSDTLGGQVTFTSAGQTIWTIPAVVTTFCVFMVTSGGCGFGSYSYMRGGGGGGTLWINNLVPTDDGNLTINVGARAVSHVYGQGSNNSGTPSAGYTRLTGTWGGNTYNLNGVGGTNGYRTNSASTYYGRGGTFQSAVSALNSMVGNGYAGSYATYIGGIGGYGYAYAGGGAGAAGYSGNGGNAGGQAQNTYYGSGSGGSGGGGGGGGACGSNDAAGNGGGVGIYGEGSSGSGGSGGSSNGVNGYGGSGGEDGGQGGGLNQGSTSYVNSGGSYGGGGGSADNVLGESGDGAPGVVRIIWGAGRAYPSTGTLTDI